MGTVLSSGLVAVYSLVKLIRGGWVVSFPRGMRLGPDWTIIKALFRFGLPTGLQGAAGVARLGKLAGLPQQHAEIEVQTRASRPQTDGLADVLQSLFRFAGAGE